MKNASSDISIFRESWKMHVEADKYNTGALVQKYEAGIKGFFKDEDLVSLTMFLLSVNLVFD